MAVLIDLDAPPPPTRPRPAPPKWPKPLLAALFLLVLGGAASPGQASGTVKTSVTSGAAVASYGLTASALYTVDLTGARVQAIPLVPGGPRWTVPIRTEKPVLAVDDAGTTVVVDAGEEGAVTFLDARTGRVRWRAPEFAEVRVLGEQVAVWTAGQDYDHGPLRMIDLATGRTRWHTQAPVAILDGDRDWLLTVDPDGVGTVYAAADGRVVAKGRKLGIDPYGWGVGDPESYAAEIVIGGTLYTQSPTTLRAYRLAGLTPLWQAKIDVPRLLSPCGGMICATGEDGVTARDPATGRLLWSSPRWQRVSADAVATAGDGTSAVIDPRTGHSLRELGRGGPVGNLLVLFDRGDRAWVTGLADGRVHGSVPLINPARCDLAEKFLACPTVSQTVTVWQIR